MAERWVKIYEKLIESAAYEDPITLKVWLTLLLKANFKRKQLNSGVWIDRGECIIGQEKFAKELKLTRQKLRTALRKLEKCGNLTIKSTKVGTRLTLINYDQYQCSNVQSNQDSNQQLTNDQPTANQIATNDQPTANQQLTIEEEGKEGEKGKSIESEKVKKYSDDFERFWLEFPKGRKGSKKTAYESWKRCIRDNDKETIIESAAEYAKSIVGQGEFVKGPSPWLNGHCWEDDRASWNPPETNGKAKTFGQMKGDVTKKTLANSKLIQAALDRGEKLDLKMLNGQIAIESKESR